jgi:tripartite-type tricarboxylate transporter receptor subunit TctC
VPNTPTVIELAKTDEQRAILELIFAQQDMGRPVYGPPGMPADRKAALRKAFDDFVKDPKVQAEAIAIKIEINNPMSGAEIDKQIARLHAMSPDVVRKAGDAIKAP